MEPCRGNEPGSDAKPGSAGGERTSNMGGQTEVKLPSDSLNEVPIEPQPPGKLRRTALRFFGGRRSICVLPSFFGGRNKSQNKWYSKKGVSKSKTHDGLSKASWEDSLGSGDFEYHSQKDTAEKTHHNSSYCEFGHPTCDHKSSSLPRPKKGLRGLFNSIRRHKKNRNVEFEKNEMVALSSHISYEEVPVIPANSDQNDTECLESLSESYVPISATVEDGLTIALECINVDVMVSENAKQGSLNSLIEDNLKGGDMAVNIDNPKEHKGTLGARTELASLPNINPESTVNSQLPVGSSDQISMIFGDVASLKSFDSLTGCGDIIADQDDDSIAESTVSGERSRNAGKRSSCYVTYQGGGEEMATPDEVDGDYLQNLWENEAAEGVCYSDSQQQGFSEEHTESPMMTPEEPSSSYHMDMSSNSNSGVTESTLTSGDVLTPQSDHQGSVPNSDEGYYDSTTPGPDEEGRDRIRIDRLPRDSYSGDALYELFEPDDSLISPPFENISKLPKPDPLEFLDIAVQDSGVEGHSAVLTAESGPLEMEEARTPKLQQDLQSMCKPSKDQALFPTGRVLHDKLNTKTQASTKEDQVNPENQRGNNMQHESHALKEKNDGNSDKKLCNSTFGNTSSDAAFGNVASKTFCYSQKLYPEQNRLMAPQFRDNNELSQKNKNDLEDDLTVCFSQALVDFTKHSKTFSSYTESIGGSESNSPFAQNMQALPAIVTFDVVDVDNEGEYDQQMDMVIEEDITSPYEVFEDSYLQKDAFAECDYRMFDLYEQNPLNNTWGIASLPRHLSLTRVNQSMPSPLALNRRSRSLDTDSLELEMTDMYLERDALVSCPRIERDSNRGSSLNRPKNGHPSSSEIRDSSNVVFPSWQPETEGSLILPRGDGKRAHQAHSLYQTQARHTGSFRQPSGRVPNCNSQRLTASQKVSCHSVPQNTGLLNRPSHLPLPSESRLPQAPSALSGITGEDLFVRSDKASDGGGEALFYTPTVNSHSFNQHSKMRPVGITQGMPHFCSDSVTSVNPLFSEEHMDFTSKARNASDIVYPYGCNKHITGEKP